MRIFSFRLHAGDVDIFNFVPAKSSDDTQVGLYDLISKTLFTNAGSGSFTAGPVTQLTVSIKPNSIIANNYIEI